jgi:ribosomal protein S7
MLDNKNLRLIYNFTILNKSISRHLFIKKIYTHYNINLKYFINLKYIYNSYNRLLINNKYYEFFSFKDKRKFKTYNSILSLNNKSKYNTFINQKYLFFEKALVDYSLNNTNYYNLLKYSLKYNKYELLLFRIESSSYYRQIEFEYKKINYNKLCINIFSKILMKEGKYINIYTIMKDLLFHLKLKGLNLFNFFQLIFEKLYLPISLYKKRVAGRKMLVPNPYNLNYMNKKLWHSARLIERSLKNRKESSLKKKLIAELLDIYYDKGNSLSIKKKEEIITIIKDNKLNMRFLKRRK